MFVHVRMEFKLILILILILQVTRSIWLEGGEPPKCKGGREWDLVSEETGTAGAFSFALSPLGGGGLLAVAAAFSPGIAIYQLKGESGATLGGGKGEGGSIFLGCSGGGVSVFASGPPPKGSILCEKVVSTQVQEGAGTGRGGGKWATGGGAKGSGAVKDQPVTFRTKIKSSSYGVKPPVMHMFGGSR